MKRKLKLTDLRQVETSKEEMGFVKGGLEDRPFCDAACVCICNCTNNEYPSEQTNYGNANSSSNGTWLGKLGAALAAIGSVFS